MLSDKPVTCILPIVDQQLYEDYCAAVQPRFPNWRIIRPREGLPLIANEKDICESRKGILQLLDEMKEPQNIVVACFSDLHAEEITEKYHRLTCPSLPKLRYPHLRLFRVGRETWKAVLAKGEKFVAITIGDQGDLEGEFHRQFGKVSPDTSLCVAVVGLGTLGDATAACLATVKEWIGKGIRTFVLGCTGFYNMKEELEKHLTAENITDVSFFEPHCCVSEAINQSFP